MSTTCKLDKDEKGKKVDQKLYRSIIGKLLYLTASRPDIMFSVCMYAGFQFEPKKSHLAAIKRILKYLADTQTIGIWYSKGTSLDLVAYGDSDFAGCKFNRKSMSGAYHFIKNNLLS